MDKKKALILCYTNLVSDPRVQRQIAALMPDFKIEVCATGDTGIKDIPFYPIRDNPAFSLTRKLKRIFQWMTRQYDKYYWDDYRKTIVKEYANHQVDLVIANDIQTLPLALAIAGKRAKVLFDAHDYQPREFEENMEWNILWKKMIQYQCKKYIPRADAFMTSSESFVEHYEKFTGVKPFVVNNAAYYHDMKPSETDPGKIKLIHHGAAIPGRQIEKMIDTMKLLDERYELHLMLTWKGSKYYNHLQEYAASIKNVLFVDQVPYNQIVSKINSYDIGFYILPPTNFNNMYALSNKFFEFVQARLCLVVSPNPEMVRLVKKYDLGVLSDDFTAETMAQVLKNLTPEKIAYHKQQSHLHAQTLSAETNIQKIKEVLTSLSNHLN